MVSPHTLVKTLTDKGIHFLTDYDSENMSELVPSNSELLIGLASQEDARLRLALIAAFLRSPAVSDSITEAIKNSPPGIQLTLKVYYTAAFLLSNIYQDELSASHLTHLFSQELNLSAPAYPEQLNQLADTYQDATNLKANWSGTFHHAAQRVIQRTKKELEWGIN